MNKEKITLMKYQQELIDKSKKNYMYITDTGTGKSFISLFHYLKYRKPGQKVLIIAPSKKVKEGGWEREIKRLSESNGIEIEYEIHSYDMFRKIIDDVFERKDSSVYNCKNWFLILDEAHFIKNRTSKRSKSFKKMMKYLLKNFVLLLLQTDMLIMEAILKFLRKLKALSILKMNMGKKIRIIK